MKKFVAVVVLVLSIGVVCRAFFQKSAPAFHSKDNISWIFSPDEQIVAGSVRGDGIHLWSPEQGLLGRLAGSDGAKPLAFNAEGTLLGEQNGQLVLWLKNGARMALDRQPRRSETIYTASYCQDGSMIALQTSSGLAVVSRYNTAKLLSLPDAAHHTWCQQDLLAVAVEKTVEIWDINGGKKLREYSLKHPVNGMCFIPSRNILMFSTGNGELHSCGTTPDALQDKPVLGTLGNVGAVQSGSLRTWENDGQFVAAVGYDGVKVWKLWGGKFESLRVLTRVDDPKLQQFKDLSPRGSYTTVYKHAKEAGSVHHLVKVAYEIPADR